MIKLTARQKQAFEFIKSYIKANKFSPSVMDVANDLGVTNNAASDHINALVKKGAVSRTNGKARSITPVAGIRIGAK